ncbi:BF3164 family lipoprotein [Belliella kenyensis]|uniref:BF3164 family lipoprotein n=1 Tax=Belliella kenyensis TaxID=1472724 RepID=A0ABV8EIA5_9BACT|nr:BF3164 family lipoprotein [Belliella kenyensis]MCH7402742.1 TolB-like 6-bladed beta-propeller domain-containing protein [Belliella kenyensis]MDN3603710.1 BF3164 family lipoprotein [Belliella kenyensis]
MKLTLYSLLLLFSFGCKQNIDKHFKVSPDKIINVSNQIIDIETDLLFAYPIPKISNKYLFIIDPLIPQEKKIHVFDKVSLKHIGSIGITGEGPGELSNTGDFALTPNQEDLWIPDFAKLKLFKFNIDSALNSEDYLPYYSNDFENDFFLSEFQFINENIAIGKGIEVLSSNSFRARIGKWNIQTGKIDKFGEEHPLLLNERTNGYFDYSEKHKLMAFAYISHDVLTVLDPDGIILFNIYGPKEFDNENRKLHFFSQVFFTDNYIITSYLGDYAFEFDNNKNPKSVQPSKILIFNLNGELVKAYETDYQIWKYIIDEENKRIICSFMDREQPLGYFQYD